jgi:hypothetical protein
MSGAVVKIDTSEFEKALVAAQKQIPYAISVAINDVAFQVQRSENAAMSTVFKNPRAFTQRSAVVDRAAKGSLTAVVRVKDAQAAYLLPYEVGGLHELPGQALLNPKNVPLDAFGQLRKGKFKALASKPGDFIGTVHGVTGLWQRPPAIVKGASRRRKLKAGVQRIGLKLLVRFGNALPVTKHLDFVKRATDLVTAQLPQAMEDAVAKALRTMKP